MKKIICLLLALTCVFAVCSCGGGSAPEEASIEGIVNNSKPTKVTTMVSYVGAKTLNGKFINTIDGNKSVYEYEFERMATVEDMNDGAVKTIQGKIYYKEGKVSANEGESWEDTSVTQVANFKLKLDKRNFKTYEYTTDGNSVNATIAPENVKSVLGISVSAASDVKVSITTNGTFLNRITITYKTIDGASVAVDTSYTYAPVTLEF